MTRIVGAVGMGLLFLTISPNLRAKLFDSLAAAADAVDRCGVSAYVGLAIVLIGGLLIVLNSGSEARHQQRIIVKRKSGARRQEDGKVSKLGV